MYITLQFDYKQRYWLSMLNSAMPEPTVQILNFKSELSEVERANESLRELWVRCALPEDLEETVVICLEEILSNVIRHGCAPGQECDHQEIGAPFIFMRWSSMR
jgi:hypothetical protein